MNSGFMQIPKSFPARLPDLCSSKGKIIFSTVPGSTVLRMTTTWNLSAFRNNSPICSTTLSTCPRPRLPFSLLGVPTQTSEMSPNFSSSLSACRRPASTPRRIRSSKPGSMIGLLPELIRDNLFCCKSTPVTACPISAKQAAVTEPTYPIPKTVIFIREIVAAI